LLLSDYHPSFGTGTSIIGQIVGDVPSGLNVTPPEERKKRIKELEEEGKMCPLQDFYYVIERKNY
jgi:hypothetical protein